MNYQLIRRSLAGFILGYAASPLWADPRAGSTGASATTAPANVLLEAAKLGREKEERDQTLWQSEVLAQEYEQPFIRLWDQLRAAPDKFRTLAEFPFKKMRVGKKLGTEEVGLGVNVSRFGKVEGAGPAEVGPEQWGRFLAAFQRRGYQVVQTEWHHSEFDPATEATAARSKVSFEIHFAGAWPDKPPHFAILKGALGVTWAKERAADGTPQADTIDATDFTLVERERAPGFKPAMQIAPEPPPGRAGVTLAPLIVQDLDGDGLPEIILGGVNAVFWNKGHLKFDREDLFEKDLGLMNSGAVGDFDGDGRLDFLGVTRDGEAYLVRGDATGRFRGKPEKCWDMPANSPSALTAGDVNGDGSLDVWFTQYKPPYLRGQMPTPFYDANDGYPSALFVNDGHGHFTDRTEASGLADKRNRRTYSASLVDLNGDGALDLAVVSDFCGLDLYLNDGKGRFTEASSRLADERHGFGMAHTFGDFDRDGKPDLYVAGMSSTTARRLDRMGLAREDFPDYTRMRLPMTYGNRLFQWRDGRFVQTALNDHVARAGWAWGGSAFDFDNDGGDDLYVANGHISGNSATDYCTAYWRHDLYAGNSKENPVVANLLTDKFRPNFLKGLDEGRISWNGHEHKRLFMNLAGKDFVDVGFLEGVSFEEDCRGVVAADLDGDGRQDLLVVSHQWVYDKGRADAKQSLYVLRNEEATDAHWIGVRLWSKQPGLSAIGARVIVEGDFGRRERSIVTGDSFYAQHPAVAHFGLGKAAQVKRIEVIWPGGKKQTLDQPAVDHYHAFDGGGAP